MEVKRDNLLGGMGQCIAEMVAAQMYNGDHCTVYGVVTDGANWMFMSLDGEVLDVDSHMYPRSSLSKLLGILKKIVATRDI